MVAANVAVCYSVAQPVEGVGIAMPGFAAPLAAVGLTWLLLLSALAHEEAHAVACSRLGPGQYSTCRFLRPGPRQQAPHAARSEFRCLDEPVASRRPGCRRPDLRPLHAPADRPGASPPGYLDPAKGRS